MAGCQQEDLMLIRGNIAIVHPHMASSENNMTQSEVHRQMRQNRLYFYLTTCYYNQLF